MAFVTTSDNTDIFYKDWGPKDAQPIVFHHGWPLSSDDWDNQMLFFLAAGFRVVAHDRRGHGRSSQTPTGHDMDHYAADASAVVEALDLRNAVHVGHSTGGGEVARYVAQYGQPQGRVAKAVLLGKNEGRVQECLHGLRRWNKVRTRREQLVLYRRQVLINSQFMSLIEEQDLELKDELRLWFSIRQRLTGTRLTRFFLRPSSMASLACSCSGSGETYRWFLLEEKNQHLRDDPE